MKTFIASLCAFFLLILLIIWNSFFVRSTTRELERSLSEMPICKEAEEAVERLYSYWEKQHLRLSLSIAFADIHNMDVCVLEMKTAVQNKDALQFETARLLALDAIEDMQRLERITWDSIL